MKKETFYKKPSEASVVKQTIVATYFGAWKNVLKSWGTALGYVDLYSGPGVYDDGSPSTPLLILQQAIEDDYLSGQLVTVFNDGDSQLAEQLRKNIAGIEKIGRLRHSPKVYEHSVSENVVKLVPPIPTLLFADPWGYKGLSLKLIKSFLATKGSDCIFFFNYNRINAGLSWQAFDEPLDAVFGNERATKLRAKVALLTPSQRESAIIGEMQQALREIGARCALPFRFVSKKHRTSHHLLFVSKHPLGCQIMKNIMSDRSSGSVQGLGSFEFTGQRKTAEQLLIPGLGPLEDLQSDLGSKFAGRTLTFKQFLSLDDHARATEKNYRDAILEMESKGLLTIKIVGRRRRILDGKLTLPEDAIIKFKKP